MFRFNGPLYQLCLWISRFMALNVLFIVSCVGIITVFPAMAATGSIASDWARGRHPSLLRAYWHAFARYFKDSLIIGALFTGVFAIVALDYRVTILRPQTFHWLWSVVVVVCFLLALIASYAFVLVSRYEIDKRSLLLTSFRLAAFQIHITVLQLFTLAVIAFVASQSTFIDAFFTFSVLAYVNAWYVEYKIKMVAKRERELSEVMSA